MQLVRKLMTIGLSIARKIWSSSPTLRNLLYELRNREEFANLYEHEKMLADVVRVDSYKRAIEKFVGCQDVVLDLGTGTGILSFLAAKQGAKKVFSIDHSSFIDVARIVARHNGLSNIEFLKTNSREFHSEIRFDLIIHEQMGDYLLNENMVSNLLDLKRRLLKPAGRILPGKFELYVEPVDLRDEFNVPFIWENNLHGIDFSCLAKYHDDLDVFKPSNYRQEWLDGNSVKAVLTQPTPVLTFDLNVLTSEDEIPRRIEVDREFVHSGMFDGFCLYFRTIFDEQIQFDTSPLNMRTHWGNCFFRIETRQCTGGEHVKYIIHLPDFLDIKTWSVQIMRLA